MCGDYAACLAYCPPQAALYGDDEEEEDFIMLGDDEDDDVLDLSGIMSSESAACNVCITTYSNYASFKTCAAGCGQPLPNVSQYTAKIPLLNSAQLAQAMSGMAQCRPSCSAKAPAKVCNGVCYGLCSELCGKYQPCLNYCGTPAAL